MDNSLIIDCSHGMELYIFNDNQRLQYIDSTLNKHTDELLNKVDELLKEFQIKISDIKNLCVTLGPGSFTGVRVAISIVKGLFFGIDSKIYSLTNFDLFEIKDNAYYLILEGFSNFVYFRKVQNGKINDSCIDLEMFISQIKNENIAIYVENEKLQNLFKNYKIDTKIALKNEIFAFFNIIKANKNTNVNSLSPIYLRASQAEIERNKKLKLENK